jgi:hypothetical protein
LEGAESFGFVTTGVRGKSAWRWEEQRSSCSSDAPRFARSLHLPHFGQPTALSACHVTLYQNFAHEVLAEYLGCSHPEAHPKALSDMHATAKQRRRIFSFGCGRLRVNKKEKTCPKEENEEKEKMEALANGSAFRGTNWSRSEFCESKQTPSCHHRTPGWTRATRSPQPLCSSATCSSQPTNASARNSPSALIRPVSSFPLGQLGASSSRPRLAADQQPSHYARPNNSAASAGLHRVLERNLSLFHSSFYAWSVQVDVKLRRRVQLMTIVL